MNSSLQVLHPPLQTATIPSSSPIKNTRVHSSHAPFQEKNTTKTKVRIKRKHTKKKKKKDIATMTSTTSTAAAADAFILSYARAVHLSAHTTDTSIIASAIGAHYGPRTSVYTPGRMPVDSSSSPVAGIATHLARFERSGLGCDVRLAAHRVEVVSEAGGSAMCWLKWRIRPRAESGVGGWEWENVYGYRRKGAEGEGEEKRIGGEEGWAKPEGYWELIVCDNEILGLLERMPNFTEL